MEFARDRFKFKRRMIFMFVSILVIFALALAVLFIYYLCYTKSEITKSSLLHMCIYSMGLIMITHISVFLYRLFNCSKLILDKEGIRVLTMNGSDSINVRWDKLREIEIVSGLELCGFIKSERIQIKYDLYGHEDNVVVDAWKFEDCETIISWVKRYSGDKVIDRRYASKDYDDIDYLKAYVLAFTNYIKHIDTFFILGIPPTIIVLLFAYIRGFSLQLFMAFIPPLYSECRIRSYIRVNNAAYMIIGGESFNFTELSKDLKDKKPKASLYGFEIILIAIAYYWVLHITSDYDNKSVTILLIMLVYLVGFFFYTRNFCKGVLSCGDTYSTNIVHLNNDIRTKYIGAIAQLSFINFTVLSTLMIKISYVLNRILSDKYVNVDTIYKYLIMYSVFHLLFQPFKALFINNLLCNNRTERRPYINE